MHILENELLVASFDESNGVLASLFSKKFGVELISNTLDEAFILERAQDDLRIGFERFTAEAEASGTQLTFRWDIENAAVCAEIILDGACLFFRHHAENTGDTPLCSIEYPLIDGIREFGPGEHAVAHSFATGLEIDNPLQSFAQELDGFRYMPYPESFSGASMQFFGYGKRGGAGLYFAAYDGGGHQKWLNFYKRGGALRASQITGYEDVGPRKGINAPWDFVVKLIPESGWEAFADEYKGWAGNQSWTVSARNRPHSWLQDYAGASTFGINASHERTKWIKRYREDIGVPLFHILGPDWPKENQNFYNSIPGGLPDWFPSRFSKENIDCIHAQGDKFAPFEFDFLAAVDKADKDKIRDALQKWPDKPKSVDKYTFTMLCPVSEYTRGLHVERDVRLAEESGCDAFYYDISANNILKTCMSGSHGHAVGGGAEMTRAYQRIYRETKEAAKKKLDKNIPAGAEMINETLIGELDYYQARANAQPGSALETWPFRALIRQNKARVIPLFAYVYGPAAPIRLDGWGKLTKEYGDLIYHTIAKTYLWGGLFEINQEYSEMERLDGESNSSEEHFYHFRPEGFAYDAGIAGFIGKCAGMRLGPCGEAMIKGEMLRSVSVQCRKIYRTYYQYNHGIHSGEQSDRGIILLDSVLAQGYTYNGGQTVYIVNTSLFQEEAVISLPDAMQEKPAFLVRGEAVTSIESREPLRLTLAPLEIIVVNQF